MLKKAQGIRARDGRTIRYDTIKARLYPTPEQAELFEKTFGCCRYIWNRMLSDQQRFYEETGLHFIPTSKMCSNCGRVRDVSVAYRKKNWKCPYCGAVHDREVNAAKNIKFQGLLQYQASQEVRKSV